MRLVIVVFGLTLVGCETPLTPIDKCEPRTCGAAGAACGPLDDGCGGVLDCGACAPGSSCGIGGANVCGQGPDGGSAGGTAGGAGGGAAGGTSAGTAGGGAGGASGGAGGSSGGSSAGGAAGGASGGSAGGASGGSAGGTGGSSAGGGAACPAPNSSGPSSSYTFAQWPVASAPFTASNYSVGTCGTGTVLDVTTGLVWQQQQSPSALTHPLAVSYCDTLVLGGQSDWRLPTRVELTSLQDETRFPWPSIVTSVFTGPVGQDLWASTQNLFFSSSQPYFYVVTFVGGAVSGIEAATTSHFVRCVRSGPALSVTNRYTFGIDPDGTPWARDVGTGLTWKRIPESGFLAWSAAVAACVAPWRLPSIRELHTLQDPTRAVPPQINQGAFAAVAEGSWSSSVSPQSPTSAYGIAFSNSAGAFGSAQGVSAKVLCVR